MLLRIFKYLKGYVKIKVEGYSPERFLNLCNANGILVWGVEHKNESYIMYVAVVDYKRMRPFVRKTGTKIYLLERKGFPFFLYKFRKRKIFFAGIVFCIVLIYVLSLFVWNIHFQGNVTQTTEELLISLEEMGVSHGTLKSGIICENIETELRKKYPNILWVSAELRGTRIVVQIKENTDQDIISAIEERETEPASIITEYDGKVASIIVRQGTPLVMEGEEVTKGQTLVLGYYEIKNDAGEVVRYEEVPADADITLLVKENYQDVFSTKYYEKEYTNKKRLGIILNLFDKQYAVLPSVPYEKYDTVQKNYEIHVTENFYIPVSIKLLWYLEFYENEKNYPETEIKKLSEARFQDKYKNILQKGVQIIEKNVKINTNGKLCHATGTVQLSVPVNTKVPVVLPDTANEASLEGEN